MKFRGTRSLPYTHARLTDTQLVLLSSAAKRDEATPSANARHRAGKIIVEAILDERQPVELTAYRLKRLHDLPPLRDDQLQLMCVSLPTGWARGSRNPAENCGHAPAYKLSIDNDKSDGGAEGSRTPDLYNAIVALSQLSYGPMGLGAAGDAAARSRPL